MFKDQGQYADKSSDGTTGFKLHRRISSNVTTLLISFGIAVSILLAIGVLMRYQQMLPVPKTLGLQSPVCGSWMFWPEASEDPVGEDQFYMLGVDALDANNVWAVGYRRNPSNTTQLVIRHWDGTDWSFVPNTSIQADISESDLIDVHAFSTQDVWAVGSVGRFPSRPLILHWDGRTWDATSISLPSEPTTFDNGALYAITALAENDIWAVGDSGGSALSLHWNGIEWSVVPNPGSQGFSSSLRALVALAPNNVWAAGYKTLPTGSRTLFMNWDGKDWHTMPGSDSRTGQDPNESSEIAALTAISPDNIWAVGFAREFRTTKSLIQRWDGRNWSITTGVNASTKDSILVSVAHDSDGRLWAVGYTGAQGSSAQRALAQYWNGQDWNLVPGLPPDSAQGFFDISVLPDGQLWLVGSTNKEPLAARFSPGTDCTGQS